MIDESARPYTEEDAADDIARGYSDIPDAQKLRLMSYIALCGLFVSCDPGSQKFYVVEAEKRRRDALPEGGEKTIENQSTKPTPDHWYKKPIPVIFLAVTSGLVLIGIRYFLKNHLGLDV